MARGEQQEIKQLKARVLELEKVNATQSQLIGILKSMPGCQGVTLKDGAKAKGVLRGRQKKSGEKSSDGAQGQPEGNGKLTESNHSHVKELEEKLPQRI